jgi:5'-nucleotidase
VRILVTNDDGIDSTGLHVLARALEPLGDVFVVAPDSEYSGASAALGAIHLMRPEVHTSSIDGFSGPVNTVSGPPALCVLFGRMGLFGAKPDLVVAGINPGANVGRAVYHSGTVGAAITARTGGITGIAISQDVAGGVDGQATEDSEAALATQRWESAAEIAVRIVRHVIDNPPDEPGVLNVNVPNLDVADMGEWRWTDVGVVPPRTMGGATLEPVPGKDGSFRVNVIFGETTMIPESEDGGAVQRGHVSLTWISRYDRHKALEFDLPLPLPVD